MWAVTVNLNICYFINIRPLFVSMVNFICMRPIKLHNLKEVRVVLKVFFSSHYKVVFYYPFYNLYKFAMMFFAKSKLSIIKKCIIRDKMAFLRYAQFSTERSIFWREKGTQWSRNALAPAILMKRGDFFIQKGGDRLRGACIFVLSAWDLSNRRLLVGASEIICVLTRSNGNANYCTIHLKVRAPLWVWMELCFFHAVSNSLTFWFAEQVEM